MKTRIVSFILMLSLVFSLGANAFATEGPLDGSFVPEAVTLRAQDEPLPAALMSSVKTGWQLIDGSWYYFNSDGSLVTSNWASDKSGWYFMGPDGRMMEGFREIALGRTDDGWYYFNPEHDGSYGRVLTGWQQIGGTWYYFNPKHDGTFGRMVRGGWVSDKTGWYFMDADGEMMEGLSRIALGRADDGLYYFNPKHDGSYGRVLTGWRYIGGVWYYFNPNHDGTWGRAYDNGWNRIGGKYYYFYFDGVMAANTVIDGWYVDSDGVREIFKNASKLKVGVYVDLDYGANECTIESIKGNKVVFDVFWYRAASIDHATATFDGSRAYFEWSNNGYNYTEGYLEIKDNGQVAVVLTYSELPYISEGTYLFEYFGTEEEHQISYNKGVLLMNDSYRGWARTDGYPMVDALYDLFIRFYNDGTFIYWIGKENYATLNMEYSVYYGNYRVGADTLWLDGNAYDLYAYRSAGAIMSLKARGNYSYDFSGDFCCGESRIYQSLMNSMY